MIVKLTKETMHYANQFQTVRELSVDYNKLNHFLSNTNNIALMEVINEKVVGLVWGYILDRMDASPMMFIYSVDVIEEFRRRGIAKKLVKSFVDFANEQGFRNSFLITDKENIPANMLYRSLGGKELPDKTLYMFFKEGDKYENN